jgi:hypothetical protein
MLVSHETTRSYADRRFAPPDPVTLQGKPRNRRKMTTASKLHVCYVSGLAALGRPVPASMEGSPLFAAS